MKQLIFIYLLLPLYLFAQPITFDKLYPNGRHAYAVIPNSQGYVMAGNSQSQDYWLCQTDFGGNVLWEKIYGLHYGYVDAAFLESAVSAKDKGYFLVGTSLSMPDSNWQKPYGYIVKTDSMGNKQWEKALHTTYDSTRNNYIYSVTATQDGGCLAVGQMLLSYSDIDTMPGFEEYAVYAVKLDSNGNIEWEKIHPYGYSVPNYSGILEIPNNQGYIIAYSTSASKKGIIVRLDLQGDTLWSKLFVPMDYDSTQYYGFLNISPVNYNTYIASGSMLVEIDIDGNVNWQNDVGQREVQTYQGNLYAYTWTHLRRLDPSNGNVIWTKDMGTQIGDFAKTPDGGFILLSRQGTSAIRLIKTDCEGNVQNPIFCTTNLHPEATQMEVYTYPNPIEDKVNIKMTTIGNYEIQVLDIQGKCLQAIFIKDSDYSIMNTEKLGKGMYILSIKNLATTQTYQTKLVKE